ncbi:unnamed protein product [Rotaria magnacalcarata]|uniref:ADP-ribosylation factor-like protein 13B n=3 Tax=Rotaria magnacalcarata TaxID=392030 RepID=A0A816PGH1_9BILA|nr:unnamed protein product [Rotaria magnacalcarata]CAF2047760.1 unnamed protein product [Rotaria magnacalcarata]CAF3856393.1 unnamed protein product [Rotaria magnacalcarata]
MGGTPCKGSANTNKPITIAILGLDNAGKTTTTRVLEKAPVDSVTPTVGYSQTEITHKNERIKLIDLGGAKTFREAWRHYYDDAYGFVYVLDSSEENRLGENRDVLKKLLQEEKVKGKPILILANKQDKADALDKNTILEDLKIERLVNENQTLCRVELCTAKSLSRNGKNSKIDESIRHGFDWLIKVVYEHFDTLNRRVEQDVQNRTEVEQKSKRERQERVKKLREERDKEEGTQDNNDEDHDTIKNGFIPIEHAVKNAERNAPEKPTKDKSNRLSNDERIKSKAVNENASLPPIPAPRSSSHTRTFACDDNSDGENHPRRHSIENSPRRKESPVARSASSNFDENQQIDSTDEQTTIRSVTRKKKKVIGPGRSRLNGDNLPPLAPSSASSRRDDFPQNKGPPLGTPRPPALVAQWAITSPSPHSKAEKLTTITSDGEHDDEQKYDSLESSKRAGSPHLKIINRITRDRTNQLPRTNNINDDTKENLMHADYQTSSRDKRHTYLDQDGDDNNDDGSVSRRSTSKSKSRSKLNDEDNEFGEIQKKTNPKEQDRYSKRVEKNDDDVDIDTNQNLMDDDYKKSSRHTNLNNNDDDGGGDESSSRRSSARQKSRSKFNDENEQDDLVKIRKKSNPKEQDLFSKQRIDKYDNDNDEEDDFKPRSNRRTPSSSARKTAAGDSSYRSHSRTERNIDEDLQ